MIIDQDRIVELINESIVPYTINEQSPILKKLVKAKYTEQEYMVAIEAGIGSYLKYDNEGKLTHVSVNKFIEKLGGILYNKRMSAQDPEWHDHISSLKKKYKNDWSKDKIINDLNIHYKSGVSIKSLYKLAIGTDSWADLRNKLEDETLNSILLGRGMYE